MCSSSNVAAGKEKKPSHRYGTIIVTTTTIVVGDVVVVGCGGYIGAALNLVYIHENSVLWLTLSTILLYTG